VHATGDRGVPLQDTPASPVSFVLSPYHSVDVPGEVDRLLWCDPTAIDACIGDVIEPPHASTLTSASTSKDVANSKTPYSPSRAQLSPPRGSLVLSPSRRAQRPQNSPSAAPSTASPAIVLPLSPLTARQCAHRETAARLPGQGSDADGDARAVAIVQDRLDAGRIDEDGDRRQASECLETPAPRRRLNMTSPGYTPHSNNSNNNTGVISPSSPAFKLRTTTADTPTERDRKSQASAVTVQSPPTEQRARRPTDVLVTANPFRHLSQYPRAPGKPLANSSRPVMPEPSAPLSRASPPAMPSQHRTASLYSSTLVHTPLHAPDVVATNLAFNPATAPQPLLQSPSALHSPPRSPLIFSNFSPTSILTGTAPANPLYSLSTIAMYEAPLPDDYYLNLLAWEPSRFLAMGYGSHVSIMDPPNPRQLKEIDFTRDVQVCSLAWSNDRMLHVGCSDGRVLTLDVELGTC